MNVATIAIQVGYVATIAIQNACLRLCAIEESLCDFARPRNDTLGLCTVQKRNVATLDIQVRYVATIVIQNGFFAFLCDQRKFMRL